MVKLWDRIRQLGDIHGVELIGAAELTNHRQELERIGSCLSRSFPHAISIGIPLPKPVVKLLEDRTVYENRLEYKIYGYDIINSRLEMFTSIIASYLQKEGYRVMPLPAAERIDSERICASVSHKSVAYLAGFGWIGKNCLLVHPQYGPAVRWGTILTDAPVPVNSATIESRCGDCRCCKDACPVGAIKGKVFIPYEDRQERLDVEKCEAYFQKMHNTPGEIPVCGMCLFACPYGK